MNKKGVNEYVQSHRKRSFLRVRTGERHPGDVQRMRKGTENLCPDDTKVPYVAVTNLGKNSIEYVS
jgi:hypothetical protein